MQNKIKSLAEMEAILKELHATGKCSVFTNGCFDLLHIGHIRLLQFARSLGDLLIVGLNSDLSVKKNKGQNRPIVPQAERAEILAALECCDYIVLFDELTPIELIRKLHPSLHVKGGDYDPEKLPEYEVLHSYGAKTVKFEYLPDHSSTDIISRVLALGKGELTKN